MAEAKLCHKVLLFALICSLNSSNDLMFERKRIGCGGLKGCLRSLVCAPALQPRFCFPSLHRLRLLPAGPMVIHVVPGLLATSTGILCAWTNSRVTFPSRRILIIKNVVPAVGGIRSAECAKNKNTHKKNIQKLLRLVRHLAAASASGAMKEKDLDDEEGSSGDTDGDNEEGDEVHGDVMS